LVPRRNRCGELFLDELHHRCCDLLPRLSHGMEVRILVSCTVPFLLPLFEKKAFTHVPFVWHMRMYAHKEVSCMSTTHDANMHACTANGMEVRTHMHTPGFRVHQLGAIQTNSHILKMCSFECRDRFIRASVPV